MTQTQFCDSSGLRTLIAAHRALARAVQVYREGDQAIHAAYAELKRTFEKRGDHWTAKRAAPQERG